MTIKLPDRVVQSCPLTYFGNVITAIPRG